jgi:hypothetical protein
MKWAAVVALLMLAGCGADDDLPDCPRGAVFAQQECAPGAGVAVCQAPGGAPVVGCHNRGTEWTVDEICVASCAEVRP